MRKEGREAGAVEAIKGVNTSSLQKGGEEHRVYVYEEHGSTFLYRFGDFFISYGQCKDGRAYDELHPSINRREET